MTLLLLLSCFPGLVRGLVVAVVVVVDVLVLAMSSS
jgi:hypothetical protein